jgi:23S rRNA pseudouridine2605 synthase
MPENDRPAERPAPELIRLQKVMATAGVGSRRACEVLIDQGRVEVNGQKVREQGMRVDPQSAVIKVDGLRITTNTDLTYLALNKPEGVISTLSDPEGRMCVGDYVFGRKERLFYVGRLDAATEGLLLLTNDGELAHRLTHPSYEVEKTYLAEIEAPVPRDIGKRLREGVDLDDGPARVTSFRVVSSAANRAMVELTLHEGRNHIVRRMLEAVDRPVTRLVRTQMGPVKLGPQKLGVVRALTQREVGELYDLVGM